MEPLRFENQRRPDLCGSWEPETRRGHPGDGVWLIIDQQGAAYGGSVAAELLLPPTVRQDHAFPVFRRKESSYTGIHPEDLEEIRGHGPGSRTGSPPTCAVQYRPSIAAAAEKTSVMDWHLTELHARGLHVSHLEPLKPHPRSHDAIRLAQAQRV